MNLREILPTAILLLFSQTVSSHNRECLEPTNTQFNRPCIERLIPRSLALDKTMLEPGPSLFTDNSNGSMSITDRPLIAVLGASGRTGVYVLEELKSRDVDIRALSRNIETAQERVGGDFEWMPADVTDPKSLLLAFEGVDILISTIGSTGGDNSEMIDYKGSINFIEAAKETGIRQVIYMSSIGAGGAENFSTVILNLVTNKTMKWKSLGEDYIRNSGINFTIVRPGGLRGEPGALGIRFEQGDEVIGWIPRGDVAAVMVESIFNDDALNKTFEVINDESLPIEAWKDEFRDLKEGEFGQIATGDLPITYWLTPLVILLAIVYLIRRRQKRA